MVFITLKSYQGYSRSNYSENNMFKKTHYRKIWENHYGPIPRDDQGRTYEIHHIDGNHDNDEITNLMCITIQEHYDIHFNQGDWVSCQLIATRLSVSPEEKSMLSKKGSLEMVENGTHPFLRPGFSREVQKKRVQDGTHHFLSGEVQRQAQLRLVAAGKHHNQDGSSAFKQLENGTHPSQLLVSCIYCRETHSKPIFSRDHGDECSIINPKKAITIDGVTYNSKKLAAEVLGITEHQAQVLASGKTPRPTFTYEGIEYPSIRAATKATGLSWEKLTGKRYQRNKP